MTVSQAIQMWSRHDAQVQTDDGRKKTASIREVYTVTTDVDDSIVDVLAAPGLPQTGQRYPGTPQLIVKRRAPRQVSPIYWHIEIVYEGESGPGGFSDSPLNDPPEITYENYRREITVDEDVNGRGIQTVVGESMKGVTKDISDIIMTVKRNYAGINLAATAAYLDATNSDVFPPPPRQGFAPGLGRLMDFQAREVIAEEIGGYFEVTATIHFRYPYQRTDPSRAWWVRRKHEGLYVKVGETAEAIEIMRAFDDNKEPVTKPVMLNLDGTHRKIGDPVYLEFQVHGSLPFNSLGLV